MNYRHAFHAGNLGDVLKHAVLARVIAYLQQKPAAIRIIDTHAGLGRYDLLEGDARRTGEWRQGIARVLAETPPAAVADLLAPWLDAVRGLPENATGLQVYPGSPLLARLLLRRQDRLTLTELHPQDFARLSALFAGDIQVRAIELDGWNALRAFVPPKERRGLVLIDPPFEAADEFDTLAEGLRQAWRRWSTGTYIAWYPAKDARLVRRFHQAMEEAAIPRVLVAELFAGEARADEGQRPADHQSALDAPRRADDAAALADRHARPGTGRALAPGGDRRRVNLAA